MPPRKHYMPRTKGLRKGRPAYPSAAQRTERAAWSHQFQECWVCGGRYGLQTHEIASKAQAPGAWADVRNYFRACNECNRDFLEWCPESVQLALKSLYDPDNYDRAFVNGLRHRATEAIGEGVVEWWRRLLRQPREFA